MDLKKLLKRSPVIIHSQWIWDPLTRNLREIRLRGFLYQGTNVRKNQPVVSEKVVSISRVLTCIWGDLLNLTQCSPQVNKTLKVLIQLYKYGRGKNLKLAGFKTLWQFYFETS